MFKSHAKSKGVGASIGKATLGLLSAGVLAFGAAPALAHCDGLDGPVVEAARQALKTEDVSRVLIWVRPQDADEIRATFKQALTVRRLGPEAQALADRNFFETLVRVHRVGENAPYTGLKPAGRDLGPAIPAADKALESGSEGALTQLLTSEVRAELNKQFENVMAKRNFRPDDLAAGREYVEAYVAYVHFVERLYEATHAASGGHYEEHE
ncbi:MAG: DUF6448 family protein [Pseudomonadota bacterium]